MLPFNKKNRFDVKAQLDKAILYHQCGKLQAAEIIYKKLISLDQPDSDAFHLYGFLSLQLGKAELAASLIKKALNDDPNSPLYHNSLGLALASKGQWNEAIAHYRSALSLFPD